MSIVNKLVIEFLIPLELAVRKCPIYSMPVCSDQFTAIEFSWEKEERRQEKMVDHKLNKQISVAYYNPKQDWMWFFLSACLCEVWGFFKKTLELNMHSQTNSSFTQWVILNKNVD